ncbi:MAG: HD-GYP domain-containing protein [Pseudomonadales bacterium]
MSVQVADTSGLLEVPVASLRPGMFVAALDRPWLDTPFALQGFFVRTAADISLVAAHCSYVYVDPGRRTRVASPSRQSAGPVSAELRAEFNAAGAAFESASVAMAKVFGELRRGGHLNMKSLSQAVDPLIDSVLRNSDAMAALVRIKSKGDYLFNHSLSNAVWAAVIGRHLALETERLKQLALGAAVLDVGMTLLDDELMNAARPLDDEERARVSRHVGLGLELLERSGGASPEVLEIVRCHHERHDGSGYPEGLAGQEIPLLARLAGLVDSYDAMITDRPHAPGRSSFEAVQELFDRRDQLFQAQLVEQFVQAIGMFPTGCIVELSSGEVGIVVEQNPSRRLRPKVVVVLDEAKQRYRKLVVIDLSEYRSVASGDLWISRELKPGSYGLHADEFFL